MSLFKSFESVVDNPADSVSKPAIFHTIENSMSSFVGDVESVGSMSEEQIINTLLKQHEMLLDYNLLKSSDANRRVAQEMFKNKKFLNCLIQCLTNNWIKLSEHEIVYCNKMAYDYVSVENHEIKDSEIANLLMELSWRVNYRLVSILSAVIPQTMGRTLALFYKSSYKEDVCIYRTNLYLVRCGVVLDLNTLVTVYSKLFHKMTNFFCETMFELKENDYTESNLQMYNRISEAMLYMLDTMPSADITKVLSNYAATYDIKGKPPIRFSMKTIEGYDRISSIVSNLENEGVIVP